MTDTLTPLGHVASRLGVRASELVAMSARGELPTIINVGAGGNTR